MRDGASEALPFSQVAGMVLGARAAILHGVSSRVAVASQKIRRLTDFGFALCEFLGSYDPMRAAGAKDGAES